MGRLVDHNHRYTPEERTYLAERGRDYLFAANERRFGTNDNPHEPEAHEQADNHAVSPFYQAEVRQAAVYDQGGAPLPGTVLNYDTGRVMDRDNGTTVEYTGPGHTPGANDLTAVRGPMYEDGFTVVDDDADSDIDEDIVAEVVDIKRLDSLKKRIRDEGYEVPDEDPQETENGLDYKAQLQNGLAIILQDKRDGKVPEDETEEEPANA